MTLSDARILIVDDEPANVRILQRLLGNRGYTNLRATTDPFEVTSIWSEFQPDLLLLDLMMPGRDGIEVVSELRASSHLGGVLPPVLMLTADVTERARDVCLARGVKDLITKPFDHEELIGKIEDLLERSWADSSQVGRSMEASH